MAFSVIVPRDIAQKLTTTNNEALWIWHKTGKLRNSPENIRSRGDLISSVSEKFKQPTEFLYVARWRSIPLCRHFVRLGRLAPCPKGGTGAVDVRPTNQ